MIRPYGLRVGFITRKPRASGDDPLTAYQPVIGSG